MDESSSDVSQSVLQMPYPLSVWWEEQRISWGDWLFVATVEPRWAPLLAYLLACAREGHLCVRVYPEKLSPSWEQWDDLLLSLAHSIEHPYVVRDGPYLYLKRNYLVETRFFHHWNRIRQGRPFLHSLLSHVAVDGCNEEQQAALQYSCSRCLAWIMGGPGTGKTYVASQLIDLCLAQGMAPDGLLGLAPTGKAAANLRRKFAHTEVPIQTIHAFLATRKRMGADLLIIDEGSMIDAATYAELFSRIRTGAHVILLGDPDQLPPISCGNLFAVCAVRDGFLLHRCMRTESPALLQYAAAVRRGEEIPFDPLQSIPPLSQNTMMLTPLVEGPYGVKALNRYFHDPSASQVPIVITKNAPQLDIYNGDIGVVENGKAIFYDRTIPQYALPPHEWAYALSVHKSQGSEYEHVHLLLPEGSERFGRELLYTAITRAKRSIRISAAPGVMTHMIKKKSERLSGLLDRIECKKGEPC